MSEPTKCPTCGSGEPSRYNPPCDRRIAGRWPDAFHDEPAEPMSDHDKYCDEDSCGCEQQPAAESAVERRDPRARFVEAMRVVCKHTAGYQNAQRAAVEAFADAECGETLDTRHFRHGAHAACRAALIKEIFHE